MILPTKDVRISQFKATKRSLEQPIHFLACTKIKRDIMHLNNHVLSRKLLLSTCVEKDYIIAFANRATIDTLKVQNKHPYFVNSFPVVSLLEYGQKYNTSLLILSGDNKHWYKLDPTSDIVSIHTIDFARSGSLLESGLHKESFCFPGMVSEDVEQSTSCR